MTNCFLTRKIDFAKIYIILIYFTPCFFGYTSLNTGQMIYLFLYFVMSTCFVLPTAFSKFIDMRYTVPVFLLLAFHYALSTILNFRHNTLGIGDIIEIFRPVIYFLSFLFSVMIFYPCLQKRGAHYYTNFFENIVFFSSFAEFLKYLRPLQWFFYLYMPAEYGRMNYIRFSGFTGFAYAYAWILLICIIINAVKLKGKISFRFFYFSLLVCLTGSRTGILALGLLYSLLFCMLPKIRVRLLALILIGIVLIYSLYIAEVQTVVSSFDYTKRLVLSFISGEVRDGSLGSRMRQTDYALERFYQSPLYGMASTKINEVRIELFFPHHLGSWGFMGLSLYLVLLFLFFPVMGKSDKRIYALILVISFILCFSLVLFDQIRLFNIFYMFIAIFLINSSCRKRSNSHET